LASGGETLTYSGDFTRTAERRSSVAWGVSFTASPALLSKPPSGPYNFQYKAQDFTQLNPKKKWTEDLSKGPVVPLLPTLEVDSEDDEEIPLNLYKTELCRSFEEKGCCRYGNKCQFAHGMADLRNVTRHPKYKTEICKTFHTIGTCPYGKRCRFIHADVATPETLAALWPEKGTCPTLKCLPENIEPFEAGLEQPERRLAIFQRFCSAN